MSKPGLFKAKCFLGASKSMAGIECSNSENSHVSWQRNVAEKGKGVGGEQQQKMKEDGLEMEKRSENEMLYIKDGRSSCSSLPI